MINSQAFLEFFILNFLFSAIFYIGYQLLRIMQTNSEGRFFFLKFAILFLPWLGFFPRWHSVSAFEKPLSSIKWVQIAAETSTQQTSLMFTWDTFIICIIITYVIIVGIKLIRICRGMLFLSKIASQSFPLSYVGFNIFVHNKAIPPGVLGILCPRICFSENSITHFTQAEIKIIIAHELIHIKRRDPLIHIIALITKAILFINPFASWLVIRLQEDMELSVDERVLENQCLTARFYAELLAKAFELESDKARPLLGVYLSKLFFVRRLSAMTKTLRKRTFSVALFFFGAVALSSLAASAVGTLSTRTTTSSSECPAIKMSILNNASAEVFSCGDFRNAFIEEPCKDNKCPVFVEMHKASALRFRELTAANIGKKMTTWINGRIVMNSTILEAITSDSIKFTGNFTRAEAQELVQSINSSQVK